MKNDGLGNINKKLNKAPEEAKEIKPIQTIDNECLGSIESPRDNMIASKEQKEKWKTCWLTKRIKTYLIIKH